MNSGQMACFVVLAFQNSFFIFGTLNVFYIIGNIECIDKFNILQVLNGYSKVIQVDHKYMEC